MLDFDVVKVVLTRLACFWVSGLSGRSKLIGFIQIERVIVGYYNKQSFWPCYKPPHQSKNYVSSVPQAKKKEDTSNTGGILWI
jgi:hypothetical protein